VRLAVKITPKMILVIVAAGAMCAIFAIVMTGRLVISSEDKATKDKQFETRMNAGGSSWPVFRGSSELLGRASGGLGDSLKLLWKFKTGDEVNSSAAIDDGRVFIGSDDGSVYAIDLYAGHKIWSYETGDIVEASPCVVGGEIFVGSADSFMYALDAKSGELKWKYETGGQILGAANRTIRKEDNKTLLVFGSYDGKVHCVDCADGKVVWTYETGNYVNGAPAVGGAKAIVGGCDAMIHVIDLFDGDRIRQIDASAYIAASAAILDGQVYVGNYDGLFLRTNIDSGEIAWKYIEEDSPFFSSPAIGEDVIVLGGRDNQVHCVSRDDGKLIWTFQTLGEVDSSPVICGDKVVVGSEDGRLYMLNLLDGGKVWSYEMGQGVTSSPAIANGIVVVGCDDGYVYAFEAIR
jgi:outer membrane protein assembly factor BamB